MSSDESIDIMSDVRRHARFEVFVCRLLFRSGAPPMRRQLGLRGLECLTFSQRAEDRDGRARARRLIQNRGLQRHPQLMRYREGEALAHHAHDRRVLVAELHRASEHIRIAAESGLPYVMTNHGDSRRRGLFVGGREHAAHQWLPIGNRESR